MSNRTIFNPTQQIKEGLATLQLPSVPMIISLGICTQKPRQDEYVALLQRQSICEQQLNEYFVELRVLSGAPIEPQSMRSQDFFGHVRIENQRIEEEITNPKGSK